MLGYLSLIEKREVRHFAAKASSDVELHRRHEQFAVLLPSPEHAGSAFGLVVNADKALCLARRMGKNGVRVCD